MVFERLPPSVCEAMLRKLIELRDQGAIFTTQEGRNDETAYLVDAVRAFIERENPTWTERRVDGLCLGKDDFRRWELSVEKCKDPPKKLNHPLVQNAILDFICDHHDPEGAFAAEVERLKEADRAETPKAEVEVGATGSEEGERPAVEQSWEAPPAPPPEPEPEPEPESDLSKSAQTTAAALSASIERFLGVCDKYLLFPAFSPAALSMHLSFAAFYAFLAMALTWGIYGISDVGDILILPVDELQEGDARAEADVGAILENRPFIFSVVMVVVLVAAAGILLAMTPFFKAAARRAIARLERNDVAFAAASAGASGLALGASGMHWAFCLVFALSMTASIVMAGRLSRRTLLALAYPVAFIANIVLIVGIAAVFGSVLAAGGVLPILSLICLLIGAAAQSRSGAVIAGAVTAAASAILATLNAVVFDGAWFRIDPWDPGTVLILLLIPVANGIWDWASASTTRVLSASVLRSAEGQDDAGAVRVYVIYAIADLVAAFATVIALYLTLYAAFLGFSAVTGLEASLDAYFQGFQAGLTEDRALLVIIMLVTVLAPTVLHVHMVSRAMLTGGGLRAIVTGAGYLVVMAMSLALLLNAARGILRILTPAAA